MQCLAEDGTLDRGRLRSQVFADPEARRRLEAITHPLIRRELECRAAAAGGAYQIHVIPLLVEAGLQDQVDRVLLVDCPETLQISRLRARDGETQQSAHRILAAQASREDRRSVADDILLNAGDRSVLTEAVDDAGPGLSTPVRGWRIRQPGSAFAVGPAADGE